MDYSGLTIDELTQLLIQRDEEILTLRSDIDLMQQQISTMQEDLNVKQAMIVNQNAQIESLESDLAPLAGNAIGAVNRLDREEQQKLALEIRTTAEGIKAFASFLYGAKEPVVG